MKALDGEAAAPDGGAETPAAARSAAEQAPPTVDQISAMMAACLRAGSPLSARAAGTLVSSVDQSGRAALVAALFTPNASGSSEGYFKLADANSDGVLDAAEFSTFVEMQATKHGLSTKPLTSHQLRLLGVRAALGSFTFGFCDNFIMILAGDAIQNTLGTSLGLSTLLVWATRSPI